MTVSAADKARYRMTLDAFDLATIQAVNEYKRLRRIQFELEHGRKVLMSPARRADLNAKISMATTVANIARKEMLAVLDGDCE